jgi:putative NADH-flavin reductase
MERRTALGLISAALAATTAGAKTGGSLKPILVIAATARTAPEILQQAVAQGRRVTALARHPEGIELHDPNLKVVHGDVYDLPSLAAAMTGAETVISLIGPKVELGKEMGYVDIYSVGIATVIAAMKLKGNRRLIAVSSGGTEQIPEEKPTDGNPIDEWCWRERNLYGDMQRMEKIIAVSGLEYVVLRPRGFMKGPKLDNLKLAVHEHATDFDQYRDRSVRTPGENSQLSYADFATLVLSLVDGNRYLGTSVGVYTDKDGLFPSRTAS